MLRLSKPVLLVSYDYLFPCPAEEGPSSSAAVDSELPRSASKHDHQKEKQPPSLPSSNRGSFQSLKGSKGDITTSSVETRVSIIAPPPREPSSKAKSRSSTLPSRHRGAEACYSLPRPSHSTSLTRFQQQATLAPLASVASSSSSSASPNPFSHTHAPVSPASSQPQLAKQTSTELFVLKGPPPQLPRSRGKIRCSTLPPRQRPPGPEEPSAKPSHSTSFTKLGDRIPPSPSELKRNNTPVWEELQDNRRGQRVSEGEEDYHDQPVLFVPGAASLLLLFLSAHAWGLKKQTNNPDQMNLFFLSSWCSDIPLYTNICTARWFRS